MKLTADIEIAIVSHDAGGAEILSSLVAQNPGKYRFILSGPAVKIFNRKLGIRITEDLDNTIAASELVITGTGWSSELEKKAIVCAKKEKKKVVSFLDHWSNYQERFEFDGKFICPDELWVGDMYAMEIAKTQFPNLKIVFFANPYFIDLRKRISSYGDSDDRNTTLTNILYVCEPISAHALRTYGKPDYWGYTEETAFNFFLENLAALEISKPNICVRHHPSESVDKYQQLIKNFDEDFFFSDNEDILSDIMWSSTVVGCGSMALVIGILAGRRCISVIPPGGQKSSIPHSELLHLSSFIDGNG